MIMTSLSSHQLKLKNFEGPLALLDELIGSDKLDITDIELAQVTEQYLAYIKAMKEFDIDLVSDFFVVAATLIYSKTKTLLPQILKKSDEETFDEHELLKRLQEYRYFKALGRKMEEHLDQSSIYFSREKKLFALNDEDKKEIDELTIGDLIEVIIRYKGVFVKKALPIKKKFATVEEKIKHLYLLLNKKSHIKLSEIMLGEQKKRDKITTFLGIADMTYHQKTAVVQNYLFEDFEVIKRDEYL